MASRLRARRNALRITLSLSILAWLTAPPLFAQTGSPVEVKVAAPATDGETSVQITVVPAAPVSFDLPEIKKPSITPKTPAVTPTVAPKPQTPVLAAPKPTNTPAAVAASPSPAPAPPVAVAPAATPAVVASPVAKPLPSPAVTPAVTPASTPAVTPAVAVASPAPTSPAVSPDLAQTSPEVPTSVVDPGHQLNMPRTATEEGAPTPAAVAATPVVPAPTAAAPVPVPPTPAVVQATPAPAQPPVATPPVVAQPVASPAPAVATPPLVAQPVATPPAQPVVTPPAASPSQPPTTAAVVVLPTDQSAADQFLRKRFNDIQAKVLRGRKDEARRDYRKLATDFPAAAIAPEALYAAAQLQKASATNRAAEFASISEKYPGTVWATRSLFELGQTQFLLGNFEDALNAYRSYQSQQGEEAQKPPVRMNIITCLLQLRRYGNALSELERIETDFPSYRNTEKTMELKGDCQIALGQYDKAIQTLRSLLREYPNYALAPKALLCLGLCLEETKKPQEARQIYGQIVQLYPPDRPDPPFESKAATERLAQMDKPLF